MRDVAVLLVVGILGVFAPATMAAAPDGIGLTAVRGPAAGQVTLSWNGTIPSYTVYRASDAATVTGLGNSLGNTATNNFVDTPPVGLSFYLVVGNCAAGQAACFGLCAADTDADTYCDRQDYCATDPQKVDRGQCGCFEAENTGDTDGDGVINCHDQCIGHNDAIDTDRGGLPDACDPCPNGSCPLTLPDRFYAELPNYQAVRVSRDGRWIGAIDPLTDRGYLIPTDQLIANPLSTSYYEPLGTEAVYDIRAISDDGNVVLASIGTYVPEASSSILLNAAALYDRTNGSWRVLGLYDDAINVDSCNFYSSAGDMTSDGKVVFGRTPTVENACRLAGFRHGVEADTWQLFTGPDGRVQQLDGASGDGTRIVGSDQGTSGERGVIWTDQPPGSFSPLTMPAGRVYDVTFDGSAASLTADARAYRWTAAAGLQQLGAGTLNSAWGARTVAISDGGNIVAGYHVNLGANGLPFIWVDTIGFGNLRSYLVFRGHAQLGGFDDSYVPLDLSGNGRVIVGRDAGAFSGLPGWVVVTTHP